ncbi:MAG: 16S rRNA (adenine(1518)-N(6)/adenine(1519)-N(6))-dimethyltransferase RsmA [Lachnospiraceae bacterium]|nr:16S rRNA (adenine(1518)-N(6)/adenine(1519)-N(6))-dimethyltransferase RsmA [Lachnospiraceae bacterium]
MPKPYLGNPLRCEAVLNKYGFSFRKKYGQNFLIDESVLEDTVDAAEIGPEDVVLEIGPGIGTLTQYLACAAAKVIAVEIDDALLPILDDTLSDWDNVKVLHADIMKTDIQKLADEENGGRPMKVVANLPYYITTPILMKLFESRAPIDSVTVMVQKEVAERIETGPGTKAYGALSLAIQYYAEPSIAVQVPASSFIPRPNVDSAVIVMKRWVDPPVKVNNETLLFQVIRASFQQRRKKLANGITNAGDLSFTKEQVEHALAAVGLDLNVRGEKLTLAQFGVLSDELNQFLG